MKLELSEERTRVVTFEGIGAQLGKLDEVLGLLQQKVESPALRSGFVMLPSTKTEEAAPYYIPTPTLPPGKAIAHLRGPVEGAYLSHEPAPS